MNETTNTETNTAVVADTPIISSSPPQVKDFKGGDRGKRSNRRSPRRDTRAKPEFDQKIVSLRRVTRVMAGGRRFSFSVCLVAGNRKGSVGVGQGKASDTPLAIEKAFRDAKKNMITVNTTKNMSIPYDVEAKYASSRVKIMPARGKGILAGSSVRTVFELAGLREIGAKLLSRSKNSANNAYVAIKALKKFEGVKIKN
ncbi:MAG: 30S ribosomal protein S5 [Candidatus Zambryskibacteria bacterium CG_4_9_14_3_um_filter_42_9]|uniref:Small ribosomal subunit protein uS5 n=1 Tax=Candidatus Zambryskibacteria bacterium CG22_combo_CG10-13_8_21_14_all_42_17 TaxID=1975118 RepID=A0A2H0BDJ5_9BACT|nr:MAG: 30S ribosomal protein S5 [Candidatus Zambryskibacteria bacterium CG22_combo_CG10-13_8_21_14_all_42_17]PJA36735.1 MAG: 30S ribosomal protein S5 [Candidatus Zambryskibacteria bacterium CG_4_9_14_3_um_filter_42_9]